MKWLIYGLTVILATGCCTQHCQQSPDTTLHNSQQVPLKIGKAVVTAKIFQRGKPSPTFINVHDDENTSVAAGKAIIATRGGRLIELSHGGRRNVRFMVDGKPYSVDPNRIFSDVGIKDTLEKHGKWTEAAHRATKEFATAYLDQFGLDREPVIIALHNNSEGALSIHSYEPGGEHAATSAMVHVAPKRSPDDFFYVTDVRFFNYLKERDFNVTLQDNPKVPDDGSLSVYFSRKGIPYVNVEAELSHLTEQTEMVSVVHEMVGSFKLLPP